MKIFALIPKNFNLGKKLATLMLTIFLVGIIVSSFFYNNILMNNAQNELNRQANVIISTMDSIRKYNGDQVSPLLEKELENTMLLQFVPSFAVSETFRILSTVYKDMYGDYLYKDAMINPTNINDKATDEEIKIIEKLRQQDELGGKNIDKGFLMINGKKKLYTARPIKITQSDCLSCHISLEKSPKSLQLLYEQGKYQGNQGFGWELNKVIGTKIVYVPAEQVYQLAKKQFTIIIGIFIGIFATAIFLAILWLQQYVIRPINRITKAAEAVSLGDIDADFQKKSNDEIGRLAESFSRLKASLVIAMKRLIRKKQED